MESHWKQANENLNRLLEAGQAMEGFEQYYAEEVIMQENEEAPREGKALNRELCHAFLERHPALKLQVLSVAYGEAVSMQEVLFDYPDGEGGSVRYPELAVRHWREGKIVREKFYYAS
jgi:hypothetical protein